MNPGHHDPAIRRQAAGALLLTTVFWGLSFPLNKALTMVHEGLQPGVSKWFYSVSAVWPRFVIGAVLLAAISGLRSCRATRLELKQGIGLALFMSGGLILQVDGIQYTSASTSAFLSQFYVILLPLWVYGRQRRWPPVRFLLGIALVVAGATVLADVDWKTLRAGRGEVETLLSTVFFGFQILWLERPVFHGNRVVPMTFAMFVTTAVVFLGAALLMAPDLAAVVEPWHSIPWVTFSVLLAVFCTVAAFALMNTWQPKLNAVEAGLVYAAEPVFASILAMFVPALLSQLGGLDYANETVTSTLLLGGGLITAANVLVVLRPAEPKSCPGDAVG